MTKNWSSASSEGGLKSSSLGSVIEQDASLTMSLLTVFLSILFAIAHKKKKEKRILPPYAPGSILTHIRMCTSVGELNTFRQVLQDPLTEKPPVVYETFRRVYGEDGIAPTVFTSNGEVWHSKRKAVAAAFSSNHVKRMTKLAMEFTDSWIDNTLLTSTDNSSNNNNVSGSFDVAKEMVNIAISAITKTAFEYEITSEEEEQLAVDLEVALIEFIREEPLGIWRRYVGLLLPRRRRAFAASQRVRGLMMKIIELYRKLEKPTPGTVINLVMESDSFPPDEERAAQLAEFLLAGHDTTAYSIAWILLELARNPLEQKQLREELSSLTPEEWNTSEQLKMVIKEGMRLHPVAASGSLRKTGRDIITPNKELIPKGSMCFCPVSWKLITKCVKSNALLLTNALSPNYINAVHTSVPKSGYFLDPK